MARIVRKNLGMIMSHSWMNMLLVFVPVGAAAHLAAINPNAVFALNAAAIIPLAGLLTFATEAIAVRIGPTFGALINVSLGNLVEVVIFIIALAKNKVRIVQASLVGSVLANMLLVLGVSMVVGGLRYQEQICDKTVTHKSAALLALAGLSLMIPTAFHASFSEVGVADTAVLKVSRCTSVILLLIYGLYLVYQLKSHSHLYQGMPQHIIDQQTQPGIFQRKNSTNPQSDDSVRSMPTTSNDFSHRRSSNEGANYSPSEQRSTQTEETSRENEQDDVARTAPSVASEPAIGIATATVLLTVSTALVAVCAEFMVSSMQHLVDNSLVSEAFIGVILLPIVGNAVEHVTAVTVASRNKLDLSLSIALGSSIQIALFVTPLIVIIGWVLDKSMSLYFTLFETISLFASVFTVTVLCMDGRSDYLEGALLCAGFLIVAVCCWFFPDGQAANQALGGTISI